ncbi:MAG: glycosyltransferase family 2 protein [Anaerolineaceae bacterium]|nr:glycosyltransferase family 2 protein [Anaerolineaceae bacterium]
MKKLTIFTAPKPFVNPHISIIQKNAIQSWIALGDQVEVILIGEEEGLAEIANELDVAYFPNVKRNAYGTPLVSDIFCLARQHASADILCYINADVILTPDILTAMMITAARWKAFLIVGQRWDLDVKQELKYEENWVNAIRADVQKYGRLHPAGGSDYFMFPKECYKHMPDFAIGRAGWDNWMFYEARRKNWPLIDASQSVMIVHQDHDYSHLPKGQPHYRLPETGENVRMAGGPRAIFNLFDADYRLTNIGLEEMPMNWKKFWREVEIFPLIILRAKWLSQLFFVILHPLKGYREFRHWLAEALKRNSEEVK